MSCMSDHLLQLLEISGFNNAGLFYSATDVRRFFDEPAYQFRNTIRVRQGLPLITIPTPEEREALAEYVIENRLNMQTNADGTVNAE